MHTKNLKHQIKRLTPFQEIMCYRNNIDIKWSTIKGRLRKKRIFITLHSGLKEEIPEKNASKDPTMDSISKIYFDLDKLWPKIWELGLFEMPNFYCYSVNGKLAKN